MTSWRWAAIFSICVAVMSLSVPIGGAYAGYSLCALREGSHGPCTCKVSGEAAGRFTIVPRSHCRRGVKSRRDTAARGTSGSRAAPEAAPAPAERPTRAGMGIDQAAQEANTTGALLVTGTNPAPAPKSRLDEIRARDKLICGVNEGLLGFAHRSAVGEWTGIDAEFCRAVAAAVLGDSTKVEFVPLDAGARFDALKSGKIDLLSRNTTWTMSREAELGIDFAGTIYFDGQSFMTSQERGLVSAQQLAGTTVCVQSATTTEPNAAYYFAAHGIQVETKAFQSREALVKAYLGGECDAYTADRSSLFADRAGFREPTKHVVLPEVISKEPLAPAVASGDREWLMIVRWVLAGLINAEEVGLTHDSASAAANGTELQGDAKRLIEGAATSGEKLRLDRAWLRTVIGAVGNYGEIFDSNVGRTGVLGMERGINSLWKEGGLLYAPPMW
ncbi:MAG TPA: amino acid ABC transporter substrate-binding protein [Hyphomicrobiaceae bacterium]|nr:amino acid ABC transporter substrate-binding protein [Hyphomicrobiaceae bacterium]